MPFGVEQFPVALASSALAAFGFDAKVGPLQVVVENVADMQLRHVGFVANLQSGVIPDSQRYQARMPVPAISYGRFHDVGRLRAVGRLGVALGDGEDHDFEPVAGLQVFRQVDFHGGEHPFPCCEQVPVEADLVLVIDPFRDEPQPLPLPEPRGLEFRAVGEETVFHPRHAAVVVGVVVVGVSFGACYVELDSPRDSRRTESSGYGFLVRGVSQFPGKGRYVTVSDHFWREYSLQSRYSAASSSSICG